MRFQDAVLGTNGLKEAFQQGLQALKAADRDRIDCEEPRRLTGSIDLDRALSASHTHDPRWDYAIGVNTGKRSDRVVWVEVHPASSHHITAVLKKLTWLRNWLQDSAPLLNQMPKEFVWVASGRVALPPTSPQIRRLATAGIRFVGRKLVL